MYFCKKHAVIFNTVGASLYTASKQAAGGASQTGTFKECFVGGCKFVHDYIRIIILSAALDNPLPHML